VRRIGVIAPRLERKTTGHFVEWFIGKLVARSLFFLLPDWAMWSAGIFAVIFIAVIFPAVMCFRARRNSR